MKKIKTITIRYNIIFTFCLCVFYIMGISYADEAQYPIKVEIIEKEQARYDTPENTFLSICSSSIKEDLEWYYETLTEKSVIQDKKAFQEAGIDPRKEAENFKQYFKQAYIIDKKSYKQGIILIVKIYTIAGAVYTLPYTFVEEYGKWKLTNEFASDDILLDYMDYSPKLFDGKGQRPADVNTFLAYANPTQMKTDLPAGTKKFPLHIFYGETIYPATFKAELNKQDISSQFNPKSVNDQVVELGLEKGRNVLILSIEGKREDDKTTKDSDRLVFIVP